MEQKGNKRKIHSWVTNTFDGFAIPTSTVGKKHKRPTETRSPSPTLGKKLQMEGSPLWVDVYEPTTRDDLAVHKKKVQEVENWIVEGMSGMKGRRYLLLSGPAGCGKTATVRLLAKEAGLNLIEWINPTSNNYESLYVDHENNWVSEETLVPVSQTTLFRNFFLRTSKYASVCEPSKKKNLMLIEDFPNTFLRDPSALHIMLRKFQTVGNSLVVFIVTDSTNHHSNVKNLFPGDLQLELSIINIQFNSIANGIMMKALNRILRMKNICDGLNCGPLPTREALESLIETSGGDVRSAVNALQFAVKKDVYQLQDLFSSGKKKELSKTKSRTGSKSAYTKRRPSQSSQDETDNLAVVGGKDASLFLFRALGKILYCKRDHERGVVNPLPKHLKAEERVPLLENAEDVYDKMAMGASSLSTFLHQNMMSFYSDIDHVVHALRHLTDADVLSAEWTGRNVLEDYAASVTIRGLMHANKTTLAGGGFRTFTRPQWFSISKQHHQKLNDLKHEHQLSSLTTEELATVLVPLKAKIDMARGKGNFTVTRDVGLFSRAYKSTVERLEEHDAENKTFEEDEMFQGIASSVDEITDDVPENDEDISESNDLDDDSEDFRIDDFPDD